MPGGILTICVSSNAGGYHEFELFSEFCHTLSHSACDNLVSKFLIKKHPKKLPIQLEGSWA
jgi:hypothetical protein